MTTAPTLTAGRGVWRQCGASHVKALAEERRPSRVLQVGIEWGY